MAYNILSGNVSIPVGTLVEISGNFSGAYIGDFDGDGADLINVSHVLQNNPGNTKIPYFYGAANAFGEYNLKGHSDFVFDDGTRTFTTKTGSFAKVILSEVEAGTADPTKYLALNGSGLIVLTSSSGTGSTSINAGGPVTSLQINSGSNELSGSSNLTYNFVSNTLTLTGTLDISGAINANELNINVTNKNVINLDVSGSTKFGDTLDDTHEYTGSIMVYGTIVRDRQSISSTTFSMASTNYFIAVQTSTISALSTITLPNASTLQDGQSFVIKDEQGSAQTYNIKITASAADVIDGQSEILIESPYGAINLYTNGSDKFFIY
jgi:hypothetical protein